MGKEASHRGRVTVVEDDASLLSALAFALEEEGFAVQPYASAAALLVEPGQTDCLVVDLKLPDADGLDLISELRGRGVGAPAILITTNPGRRIQARAAAASVAIVEKPLIGAELGRRIVAAINGSR